MNHYLDGLQRYFDFSGRATRTQFWMFALISWGISLVLALLDALTGFTTETGVGILSSFYWLAILIPGLALSIRRLHDTNRSGWWLLLFLVPIIGAIWILILYIQGSHPADNQYGPNPHGGSAPPASPEPVAQWTTDQPPPMAPLPPTPSAPQPPPPTTNVPE